MILTISEVVDDTSFISVQHSGKVEHSGFVYILSLLVALACHDYNPTVYMIQTVITNYYTIPMLTLLADILHYLYMNT